MSKPKRIRRKVGAVVSIALEDGEYVFGHVLEEPLIVFYDLKVSELPDVETIVQQPVLFKLWVMNHAVTSGRWPVIGQQPLTDDLKKPVVMFKLDPIKKSYSLYQQGRDIPATREQVAGLERAAVWDPAHVEDRLRDHYLGVPNKWVESLKP